MSLGTPDITAALPSDLLQHILSFCTLRELHAATQLSHGLDAAVTEMCPIQAFITFGNGTEQSEQLLRDLLSSALRRHVATIGDAEEPLPCDSQLLADIASGLGELHTLHCELSVDLEQYASIQNVLVLPLQLQFLHLSVVWCGEDVRRPSPVQSIAAAHIMRCLSQLTQLEDLSLDAPWSEAALFPTLRSLPHLQRLSLLPPARDDLMCSFIAELRSLSHLQRVNACLPTEWFLSLLHVPHNLQWQDIGEIYELDDECAATLTNLPTLTVLSAQTLSCTSFRFLGQLPCLTQLDLSLGSNVSEWHALTNAFDTEVRLQTNLRVFRIEGTSQCNEKILERILSRLHQLEKLCLSSLPAVASLAFLSSMPFRATLRTLELDCGETWRLPSEEIRISICSLTRLEQLRLHRITRLDLSATGECTTWHSLPNCCKLLYVPAPKRRGSIE